MPNSVTICGVVFTDPKILRIHAKAIAESFVVFPILNDIAPVYRDMSIISVSRERELWLKVQEAKAAFWKKQGEILGSIAGEC